MLDGIEWRLVFRRRDISPKDIYQSDILLFQMGDSQKNHQFISWNDSIGIFVITEGSFQWAWARTQAPCLILLHTEESSS